LFAVAELDEDCVVFLSSLPHAPKRAAATTSAAAIAVILRMRGTLENCGWRPADGTVANCRVRRRGRSLRPLSHQRMSAVAASDVLTLLSGS
jgi:hypothetical protein